MKIFCRSHTVIENFTSFYFVVEYTRVLLWAIHVQNQITHCSCSTVECISNNFIEIKCQCSLMMLLRLTHIITAVHGACTYGPWSVTARTWTYLNAPIAFWDPDGSPSIHIPDTTRICVDHPPGERLRQFCLLKQKMYKISEVSRHRNDAVVRKLHRWLEGKKTTVS